MPSNSTLLKSPTQRNGSYFEQQAAKFLQSQGLTLISQNWLQPKVGEIDLVLLHHGIAWDTLVFAEVRKRKVAGFGDALMSVTRAKQRKLAKTAQYFLKHHPQYASMECRFDVLAFNLYKDSARGKITVATNRTLPINVNDSSEDLIPEWVQGAFITSAW